MTRWLVAGLLLCAANPAGAQQVELVVLEEGTRVPVAGAIVRLLGDRGVVTQGLTLESGRITLRASGAGTYRIRVDRIGWSGTMTPAFALVSGAVLRQEVLLESRRVALPELEVVGRSRCSREGQGGALATALWDEVGKALFANVITIRQAAIRLHVRGFLREVDLKRRPVREWNHLAALTQGQPFSALDPRLLSDVGFIQQDARDSVLFAAPDAALLLSEEFVATHCFRAVPGTEGLVGLTFEPIENRKVSDVRGTLWVDRASSELRHLEYEYTGLPRTLQVAGLGGRVEFRRLPSGAWIVGYWHIRTPSARTIEMRVRGGVRREMGVLSGYLDLGGRADIAPAGLEVVDRAVVLGQVYDSLMGKALAGAVVRVSGRSDSAVTDSDGSFVLRSKASGDQLLVVSHPRQRLLQRGGSQSRLLSLGDTVRADFSVAPLGSYVMSVCGNPGKSRSGVIGMAWGRDGEPAAGLEVVIQWDVNGGEKREIRGVSKTGLFGFCDLPPDRTLPVFLMERRQPRANQAIRLDWGEFRWIELQGQWP